jgi:hypothetical protein
MLLIVKCNDDAIFPPDPPTSTTYYSVSGIVFDDTLAKKDVPIFIDSDSTISSEDGTFTFNRISAGDHIISISEPGYETFSMTISIPKDTNIVILLSSLTTYYSVSGIVFDVVSSDYSPAVKRGATIYIDNDSTISGDDGKFVFDKISGGNHTLSVTLPNYEPFFQTISVMKDTNIRIFLFGIKEDYFPIQENSLIRFKYSHSSNNLVTWIEDNGEAFWEIGESITSDNLKIYNVKETLIFTRTDNYGGSSVDTLYTDFQINENNSNHIAVKLGVLDGVSFDRYLDPRQEQGGVIVKSYNNPGSLISTITISLKKNVGLLKILQLGNRWSKTYELIE